VEPLLAHNKSNAKLIPALVNLSCALYLQSQRLTSNRLTTWSFRLKHRLSVANCADWTAESGSWRIAAAIDWLIVCLLSATERSVSNVARRISIRTYKVKTVNKTLPSFVSRNSWHPLVEPWGYAELDLRTADIGHSRNFIEHGKEGRGSEIEGSIRILKNVSAVAAVNFGRNTRYGGRTSASPAWHLAAVKTVFTVCCLSQQHQQRRTAHCCSLDGSPSPRTEVCVSVLGGEAVT